MAKIGKVPFEPTVKPQPGLILGHTLGANTAQANKLRIKYSAANKAATDNTTETTT